MSRRYEAIVLGLGGMGSAALAHLASRGRRVLGLEQFSPAHAQGSSHGQSRIIRQAYFEDPAYVPLLRRSYELWHDLGQQTGRNIFLRTGGLMFGRPESEVVAGSTWSAREYGLSHQVMDAAEIRRRFPVLRPRPNEVGLYEEEAGVLFPEECILAHLQVAVAAGAEARFGVRALSWNCTAHSGVRVETSEGSYEADRLLICAGAWLPAIAAELGIPLQVERNVMHWLTPRANAEQFQPGQFPIYIAQRDGVPMFYGFPDIPGHGLKAAFHHSRQYTTPDQIDRTVDAAEVAQLSEAVADLMPDAVGTVLKSVVCMYTNTPDENFVIGLHPHHPEVVVAGGFSGHGFKFCSVVGEVLADVATQGSTRHPIGLFSPNRFL